MICRTCGQMLSHESFRYVPSRDTYHPHCRSCERSNRAARRAARNANGGGTTRRRGTTSRMSGRAFGVEIELTGPSQSTITRALRSAGINVRVRGYAATNGSNWELKTDGSVNGAGLELVSPKLYGEAGMQKLETAIRALNSVGATVDRSCGIHVHIDFRNRDLSQIKDAILPIIRTQDVFYQLVAPSRRSNGYSPPWSNYDREQLENLGNLSGLNYLGPRGNVNVGSYPRHGSIEFRSHGGSVNVRKITAWVRCMMAAVTWGELNPGHQFTIADDVDELMTRLRNVDLSNTGLTNLTRDDTRTLRRFVTAAEEAAAQAETADYAVSADDTIDLTNDDDPMVPSCGITDCEGCGTAPLSTLSADQQASYRAGLTLANS